MDKPIIQLIKKLKDKNKSDLAKLLIGCRSGTEETDQYSSYWNKFLSCFIIYAPSEKYQQLQKTYQEDRSVMLQCVLEIFPKSEELEIGFLYFRLFSNEDQIKENVLLAGSWLKRAKNKLDEGKQSLTNWKDAEAISSFQECIEFSLKAVSLLLLDKYPKDHKFGEIEFKEVLNQIPESLAQFEFHKLYLYSRFWSNFYIVAKYGLENFGIGPEKLFGKEEAELAQKHADKCYFASVQLKNYLENPW
ncbi:HEPN domain-containing protein [Patescibacteria group bacterium]|nr:HEPN domain-containing protein [Patescibacteria group bacterium]